MFELSKTFLTMTPSAGEADGQMETINKMSRYLETKMQFQHQSGYLNNLKPLIHLHQLLLQQHISLTPDDCDPLICPPAGEVLLSDSPAITYIQIPESFALLHKTTHC